MWPKMRRRGGMRCTPLEAEIDARVGERYRIGHLAECRRMPRDGDVDVVAAALARGAAIDEAIDAAQRAAALTATRPGAFQALPSREELGAILSDRPVRS